MVLSKGKYIKSPSSGLLANWYAVSTVKKGLIKSSYLSFDITNDTASVVWIPNFDNTSPEPSNPS